MNILLVKPPLNPHILSTTLYEPLDLEYLAAAVRGHNVAILDMRIDRNLERKLRTFKPGLVGVPSYTCDVKTVKSILAEVKTYDGSINTVVGGIHTTFAPHDFRDASADALFQGYADRTFRAYVEALERGTVEDVPNIALVRENVLHFTEKEAPSGDLDALPFPARDLTRDYRRKYHDSIRNNLALLMTSRGCPFRCTFCACWKLMDGRYVTRSVSSIIEEMRALPEEVDIVYFSDDNTVHNVKRARELARAIRENNIKKKFQMYARADLIVRHPDLFEDLREAGVEYLTVGFEAVQDRDLDKYHKKTTVHMNSEAIRILKRIGIFINAHFIVDPDYTRDDFEHILRYVREKSLFRPAFPVLTPLPGTELYEETKNKLVIRDYDYYDFAHSVLPTRLRRKEFYKMLGRLYNKSYALGRYFRFRKDRRNSGGKDFYAYNMDGISLGLLILIRFFALPAFLRLRRAYRDEPGGTSAGK